MSTDVTPDKVLMFSPLDWDWTLKSGLESSGSPVDWAMYQPVWPGKSPVESSGVHLDYMGEGKEFTTNVQKWDQTSVLTGHLQTQNRSNLQPKFRLSVCIRIKGETILGPISIHIRIRHPRAYTRVLLGNSKLDSCLSILMGYFWATVVDFQSQQF